MKPHLPIQLTEHLAEGVILQHLAMLVPEPGSFAKGWLPSRYNFLEETLRLELIEVLRSCQVLHLEGLSGECLCEEGYDWAI